MVREKVPISSATSEKQPVFVLLVEDDKGDAFLVRKTVYKITETSSKYNYFLDHKTSLKEALKALETKKYAAVLLDLSLIDADNLEALDAIKEKFYEIPVIVLTNNDSRHIRLDATVRDIKAYLLKRHLIDNPEAVAKALDEAIQST